MTPRLIPTTVGDITPAWLTGILGHRVVAVPATPLGTGQMADTFRLELAYEGAAVGAPRSVVAKMHAADATSRSTGLALRAYEIEVRFYQELAPKLEVRTPHVWFADIDVESGRFVLVFEDMAPARQGDQLSGCSVGEATVALDELVKLHAPLWGDPALDGLEWLHRDPEGSRAFLMALIPGCWDGFRARYGERLSDEVGRAGEILVRSLGAVLSPPTSPLTVLHGDYRLDNLLFCDAPDKPPVTVVDWQVAAHGQAMTDVAYFLGAGLQVEDRRSHEEALVRGYHDSILRAGVTSYTFEACWRDYRRGTWAGLIMAVVASMLVARTDRGDDMFLTMAERHANHVLDLEASSLLATS